MLHKEDSFIKLTVKAIRGESARGKKWQIIVWATLFGRLSIQFFPSVALASHWTAPYLFVLIGVLLLLLWWEDD